ncbi:hypothetical protein BC829DRAFT_219507 [Chytridium lagenaria]|nr:hypothetical protein BC829DRAFT_219507 [Chytridium lagenaria]
MSDPKEVDNILRSGVPATQALGTLTTELLQKFPDVKIKCIGSFQNVRHVFLWEDGITLEVDRCTFFPTGFEAFFCRFDSNDEVIHRCLTFMTSLQPLNKLSPLLHQTETTLLRQRNRPYHSPCLPPTSPTQTLLQLCLVFPPQYPHMLPYHLQHSLLHPPQLSQPSQPHPRQTQLQRNPPLSFAPPHPPPYLLTPPRALQISTSHAPTPPLLSTQTLTASTPQPPLTPTQIPPPLPKSNANVTVRHPRATANAKLRRRWDSRRRFRG